MVCETSKPQATRSNYGKGHIDLIRNLFLLVCNFGNFSTKFKGKNKLPLNLGSSDIARIFPHGNIVLTPRGYLYA